MKFAILTDIHLEETRLKKLIRIIKGVLRFINKDVKKYIDEFVMEMKNNVKPEFIVVLGDLVFECDKKNDMKSIEYIVKELNKLDCPVYYVAGNHDLKNITEDELAKLFNQDKLYYSFDSNNYHFICLYSEEVKDKSIRIKEEQLDFLKNDLDKTDKKTITFVHHGLADQDLTGNPWFEGKPQRCLIANREEVRSILENSGKVISSFNSHLHWDRKHVHNNIPYYTIQSLIENEDDKGIASEAHAVVNVEEDKVDVKIKGNYPKML
ncbi:MAG: metallophosphoesterase [Patescibacteria group bacterium]|jgi:3',5'-cyclic AMP phosphodiesterase CpdA|nr:metallophosphoesterase [Patescibacteria group bacterium]